MGRDDLRTRAYTHPVEPRIASLDCPGSAAAATAAKGSVVSCTGNTSTGTAATAAGVKA